MRTAWLTENNEHEYTWKPGVASAVDNDDDQGRFEFTGTSIIVSGSSPDSVIDGVVDQHQDKNIIRLYPALGVDRLMGTVHDVLMDVTNDDFDANDNASSINTILIIERLDLILGLLTVTDLNFTDKASRFFNAVTTILSVGALHGVAVVVAADDATLQRLAERGVLGNDTLTAFTSNDNDIVLNGFALHSLKVDEHSRSDGGDSWDYDDNALVGGQAFAVLATTAVTVGLLAAVATKALSRRLFR
jgi:hypothetical protein